MKVTARPTSFVAASACCVLLALPLAAAESPLAVEERAPAVGREVEGSGTDVRRWEYVVLVRTAAGATDAATRAEKAAIEAGAAVLDGFRDDLTPHHADYRFLLRTRDEHAITGVLVKMRRQPGVLGATTVQLPETPTFPGGPSFLSSYTSEASDEPQRSGIIAHHDVPPVLDKRDLLETIPVTAGPELETSGVGGVGINLSALMKALKERAWRKREQNMREAELPILPDDTAAASPVH